ncbi:MAG TPA: tetratricopeptide repeat protein, partial [Tepidisphaeraceae bacterium]|nr:tetratricopeptide repeat protein [Tepidisphaeraceae bacterium]
PLIFYYGKANYDVPILRSFSQYAPFGLIVVCLLGLTLWGLIRGNPLALPAIVFFFVLAPSSSILAMIDEVVAEHRMYLPLAMVIIFTVIVIYIFLTNFARRETSARRGLLAAGGIIALIAIVALMIATYQRNKLYRSRLTLWTDNVNKQPNNSAALNDLGNAEIQDHLYDQARQHLERAIDMRPNIEAARLNLGQLFDMLGESDRALDQYRLACEYNNNSAYANLYLAEALAKRGNFDEPIQRLKRNVIPFIPWEEPPRVLLGALLMKTDHPTEANQQFDAVLQIDSNKVFAQKLITDKLIEFGLIKAAEEHFREIIDLTPNDSVMLNNLAWIEAAYPDASGRDGAQAVQLAQRAIALSGKNPSYLSTLAAAYAENGQYDLAAATQQQAIQLAEKAGQSSVIESWNQRLLLYRSGQPFHEKPMVR